VSNLVIAFHNNSKVTWYPDQNGTELQEGGNSIDEWPDADLLPYSGEATCDVTENLSKIAVGDAYVWYCWNNGIWRFGVRIVAHVQVLDMGDRPSWEVMSDQNLNSSSIDWKSNGSSPGDQYQWPSDLGYTIIATPDSTHNALSIDVIINDA